MAPRDPGWRALARAITTDARVVRLRRLRGAGATDAFDVTLDQPPWRVVVKLYRDHDDAAPLEWNRLKIAQRVTVPVPEPIAADFDAVWFDKPCVVMSRLPGRPDVTPKHVDSWVEGLAQALADLHQTPLDPTEGAVTGPPWAEMLPPSASELDSLTAAAVRAVTARLPSLTPDRVFTHGDFHPGNVLWHRGRISGLVDWGAEQFGSRWAELAFCRTEVCLLVGPDIADRLADAYSTIVGDGSSELAVYEILYVFLSRQYAAKALDAYREQGHAVNVELSLSRLDEQLRRALQRLDEQ
jgi:aminoglycoside phosphotransferase (APT) family kinase protein